jgi:phage terminase large subunit-like protein
MRCFDPDLPPLTTTEPMILSLDAAATRDCFAAVAVTRHPKDLKRAAIRAAKVWRPQDFPDKRIEFETVWEWIADVCRRFRIVQVCYDPFQLEDMSQRIRRELTQWAEPFNQSKDRKIADRRLYDLIMQRELSWNLHDDAGADEIRRHIANANAKHQKDQDSTLLIVKKAENRKIDLVVAASMGVHRCLSLFMEAA